MESTRPVIRVRWPVVAVVAGALVYSWVASGLRPFTYPERFAVAFPIVIGAIAVLRIRAADVDGTRRGTWVWGALFGALVVWELISFRLSPRIDHPTLSSISDSIMSTHPGRFGMFAVWLVVGYWLFRR